jgi:CDP-glucose 4,6-dehydratase
MDSKLEPQVLNQASNEIRRQYLNAERARHMLAWSPLFTLDTGIGRTISWYRDFLSGGQ